MTKYIKKVKSEFMISPVDVNAIQWRGNHSKYDEIVDKICDMKIDDAIAVRGIDKPYACQMIRSKVYKLQKGIVLRSKYDAVSKMAFFTKSEAKK